MGAGAGKRVQDGEIDWGEGAADGAGGVRVVTVAVAPKRALDVSGYGFSEASDAVPEPSVRPRADNAPGGPSGAAVDDTGTWAARPLGVANRRPAAADDGAQAAGVEFGTSSSSTAAWPRGSLKPGQPVRVAGMHGASSLNGQEGVAVLFDTQSGSWLVRFTSGEERRLRPENLEAIDAIAMPSGGADSAQGGAVVAVGAGIGIRTGRPPAGPGAGRQEAAAIGGAGSAGAARAVGAAVAGGHAATDANKELESLLLQTNWSAIYQLFHQRFGVAALDRVDRGFVVKSAVEMTMSIVAKCFALLRSDPHGRLHCTPLHIAALQSSPEAVEVIVRDLPYLVTQTHQSSNSTLCPLHIAILCGSQSIVELLLEGKANANVRTLHDVCPLHIAATTSRDICQVLLAYKADPQKRDVMGSTAIHYAAAFKLNEVIELVLGVTPNSSRLARDMDQKRVSPLHISCALHVADEDVMGPMVLLAHGAKPWQTDCHGAAACELLPWSRNNFLLQFFEKHGDDCQAAAQQWLDDQYLKSRAGGAEDADDDAGSVESPRTRSVSRSGPRPAAKRLALCNDGSGASTRPAAASDGKLAELTAEVEDLRKRLADSTERCAELARAAGETEHLRAKCAMLEQTSANQQKVFDGLQALYEKEHKQHEMQVEALQQRYSAEQAELEVRRASQLEQARSEAMTVSAKQMESQHLELAAKLQEMQSELENAKARAAAAEAEQAAAEAKLNQTILSATLASPASAPAVNSAEAAEMNERIMDLEGEVQRLAGLQEQARAYGDQQRQHLQELRSAIHALGMKHGTGLSGEAPSELLAPLDAELTRLKAGGAERETEAKAVQEQLQKLQEEAVALRRDKADADDRATKAALERQEVETRSSAQVLKMETRLKEAELEQSKVLDQAKSDVESYRQRMEAAEAAAKNAQPTIDKLRERLLMWEEQFAEEQKLRKKYHNQLQDMKGAVRVFCRFRPMIARESGDAVALTRADAFTAQLRRPAPHNDTKPFPFDAVFDGDSTQEDIFEDCKGLVQSTVDGYNVTIFAYGQTGAGKTHTMYGTPEQPGLAPRAIRCLFEVIRKEEQRGGKKFKVKAYMIELYKQEIIDLFTDKPAPKDKKNGLEVKKDVGRGIMFVEGVTERSISSPEELMGYLTEGEKKRHVTATKMNSASSRSHLLLSIIIECVVKDKDQVLYGKITLCDLAGSERPKKSEVTGDALKEAIEINKSLSALGDVIEALTKNSKNIPYRNHKLTMLMQDSLGGSAKTLMFVNCSPAGSNYEETQMSLKWASRARQVTNDVKRNADSREVARLKQVIAMMSQAQNVDASPEDMLQGEHHEAEGMDLKMAMHATMRGAR
mmetsp:Transcript_67909/g.196593  ORF Transcript_67909/g.196593 Transcript_67909/m.196593 type:complete len:1352 (-) Transcript_67909:87-4142(-)